jgi:NAD(P)H-flavin reductase
MQLIKSVVIQNQKLNSKFHLLKFKVLAKKFAFVPGQFVTVKVKDNIFRSYSIFSLPSDLPFWEIFVDITPGGPGTTYLKNLKNGDTIKTSLPAGNFTPQKDKTDKLFFGATGCGLAPARPILENILQSNLAAKVHFYWGLRNKRDIALIPLLKSLEEKYPNFSYEIILSKPEVPWKGKTGHVTEYLLQNVNNDIKHKTSIYISGSGEFIKEALSELQKAKFPAEKTYFEACYFSPPTLS